MSILFGCELFCCFDVLCYEIFFYIVVLVGNFVKMGFFVLVEYVVWSIFFFKIFGLCIVIFIV